MKKTHRKSEIELIGNASSRMTDIRSAVIDGRLIILQIETTCDVLNHNVLIETVSAENYNTVQY